MPDPSLQAPDAPASAMVTAGHPTPEHSGESVRFRVTRTSQWSDELPPCPEAYKGTHTQHAYCTLPLSQAMEAAHTDWFRRLTNHREAPGGSVADRRVPCWFVDIETLADMEAFVRRHGEVVVDWPSDGPTIEIYDGYRE